MPAGNAGGPRVARACPVPGEVGRHRRGDEGLHGFPVDLLEHEQDLRTFGDQLALAARVELRRVRAQTDKTTKKKKNSGGVLASQKSTMRPMMRCTLGMDERVSEPTFWAAVNLPL